MNVAYSEYPCLRPPSIKNESELTIDCTGSANLIVLGTRGSVFEEGY
jgi:hypothetical protein